MLVRAIRIAREVGRFDDVLVSTDDEEIAELASAFGARVPFLRSAETSNDFATTFNVVHDNFCMGCHVSVAGGDGGGIYLRENRNVKSIEGLMGAVAFCNQQTKTGLNDHELDDIVAYLNETYYKFDTD